MKNIFKAAGRLPAYTHGSFAPGKPQMKICPNCGRRIKFEADKCVYCLAEKNNSWKPSDRDDIHDLVAVFISSGGAFKKGIEVKVYAKDGCMAFKTENAGEKFVKLDGDFFLCSRRNTAFGKMVTLVFSDFVINMSDDENAEKIIVYIYESIINMVYEKHDCFYNAQHDLFPV